MAVARTWRQQPPPDGPYRIHDTDIPLLNAVFSDAFTDRYRKDGMAGVRVPYLNPSVWRFAIADAQEGAMLWRDDRGNIAAFNVTHLSGAEGWMGRWPCTRIFRRMDLARRSSPLAWSGSSDRMLP